jgi:dTDP-glucose 4,6-dehydratase
MLVRILVTGAAGFIGGHLVERIIRDRPDDQVVALDSMTYAANLENLSDVWNSPRFTFCQGSVLDCALVDRLVAETDAIVHLAAQTHVDNSICGPGNSLFNDATGTQYLLEATRRYDVQRYIHMSTSDIYGTALTDPMDENHPLNPQSPYASSKCASDRLVYSYVCTYGTPALIVRPYNNYGPRQHVEKVVPRIITQCIRNEHFQLHGGGKASRDWVYVDDQVDALTMMLDADIEPIKGEAFNIGSGEASDIHSLALAVLRLLNKPESLIEVCADRPGQVGLRRSCSEKAWRLLGWKAKTPLHEGLERTVRWYEQNTDWWSNLRPAQAPQAGV